MKKRALFSILPVGFTTKRGSGKDLDKFFGNGPLFSHIVDKTYRKAGECAYFLWEKISP